MTTVGIRELKAKLSSYIERARNGEQIVVTDHGIEVAVIKAVSTERQALMSLVKSGQAHWSGGRPKGLDGIKIKGKVISDTILEERQ